MDLLTKGLHSQNFRRLELVLFFFFFFSGRAVMQSELQVAGPLVQMMKSFPLKSFPKFPGQSDCLTHISVSQLHCFNKVKMHQSGGALAPVSVLNENAFLV